MKRRAHHAPEEQDGDTIGKRESEKRHFHDDAARKERREADLEEGLSAIYGEEREDLHVVNRGVSPLTRWLTRIVLALAIVTPLAFAGYFAYTRWWGGGVSEDPLVMQFDVPTELKSGEMATIVLSYQNTMSVPLASLAVDLNLPTTFIVRSSDPAPTNVEEMEYDLGTIQADSDGQIALTGVWVAEAPSSTSLQALAEYRPGNFNSIFHDIVTASVTTLSSALTVEMSGPDAALPGEELTYEMLVKNVGSQALVNGELEMILPDGFFVSESSPTLEAGSDAIWSFAEMPANFEQKITVTGSFASDVSGVQTLEAQLGVSDGTRVLSQHGAELVVDVTGSSLQLDLVANGSTGDVSADPGSLLRVSLRVQNSGETTLSGVSAILDLQSDGRLPIDWTDASLGGGRVTSAGVVFDAATIGDLPAGERGLFNLALPLRDDVSGYAGEFQLYFRATQGEVTVQASPVVVSLNSDASLRAEARYYTEDGSPLGNGPLPPKVGETTSYRVLWTIANGLHSLEDVTVSATLPTNIAWDDFSTADLGSVKYDASSRVVSWTISALPTDLQEVEANFSVSLVPDEDDEGTYMTLISDTSMRATDAETGASFVRLDDGITTELPDDSMAEGKGIVID